MPSKKKLAPRRLPQDRSLQLPAKSTQTLQQLLKRMQITDCDYLLVGDGSGNRWGHPAGWACTLVDLATGERRLWAGAMSSASINYTELYAYLEPLCWLLAHTQDLRRQKRDHAVAFYNVHIITDSEYVENTATGSVDRTAHSILWDAIESIKRQGLQLHWHWYARETCELNILADVASKHARRQFTKALAGALAQWQDDCRRLNPS